MAEASDTLGILYQNLLDAGCDEMTVKHCMAHAKKGEWDVLPRLLVKHRKALLEQVHMGQQRIDCLDFLLYSIQKENLGGI